MLYENGYSLKAKENDIYNFVIASSKGEFEFDEIREWIVEKLTEKL